VPRSRGPGPSAGCAAGAVCAVGAALVLAIVAAVHVVAATLVPPLLVLGVIAVLIVVLLGRGLARTGAVLLGLFGLLSDVPGTLTGLSLVRDPFEFTLAATGLATSLALLIGGVAVMLKRPTGRSARTVAWVAAAVLPTALLLSGPARHDADARATARRRRRAHRRVRLSRAALGDRGRRGLPRHERGARGAHLHHPDAGISLAVPGGSTVHGTGDVAAGEYAYVCRVAGHEFMHGTLVVSE
jgi:hypothetical protein